MDLGLPAYLLIDLKENFHFREQAIKLIELDPNNAIADIKKTVQREYKLNPILAIQFIFKGKVLPDQLKFAKIGIHPKKDVIIL
ncbi:MAG TPA: hypothetical protein ENI29_12060 [bacterium]|nr:hypothetical protein [bacterium]